MEVVMSIHPDSLLARLSCLHDPRHRQGRRYPLSALLGLLILAALHGQSSLRGMWLWARARWQPLWAPLGFRKSHPPALSTLWYAVARLDVESLERVLGDWSERGLPQDSQRVSLDGKTLRASRREGQSALRVVAAVAQELKLVLKQQPCAEGDELAAALALLRHLPLSGRLVSIDAGLLQRPLVEAIREGGGEYLGVLKNNHPELKAAVDLWVREQVSPLWPDAAAGLYGGGQRPRASGAA